MMAMLTSSLEVVFVSYKDEQSSRTIEEALKVLPQLGYDTIQFPEHYSPFVIFKKTTVERALKKTSCALTLQSR